MEREGRAGPGEPERLCGAGSGGCCFFVHFLNINRPLASTALPSDPSRSSPRRKVRAAQVTHNPLTRAPAVPTCPRLNSCAGEWGSGAWGSFSPLPFGGCPSLLFPFSAANLKEAEDRGPAKQQQLLAHYLVGKMSRTAREQADAWDGARRAGGEGSVLGQHPAPSTSPSTTGHTKEFSEGHSPP